MIKFNIILIRIFLSFICIGVGGWLLRNYYYELIPRLNNGEVSLLLIIGCLYFLILICILIYGIWNILDLLSPQTIRGGSDEI